MIPSANELITSYLPALGKQEYSTKANIQAAIFEHLSSFFFMEQKSGKSTKQIFRKRHKDNFWPILAAFTQFWIFLTKTETKYLLSSVNGPLPLCKKKKRKEKI